jgi:hypothetical protein
MQMRAQIEYWRNTYGWLCAHWEPDDLIGVIAYKVSFGVVCFQHGVTNDSRGGVTEAL